jgi:hypothetical protein
MELRKRSYVLGIWLFAFGGIVLLVGGILSVVSDILARSRTGSDNNQPPTSSVLGLNRFSSFVRHKEQIGDFGGERLGVEVGAVAEDNYR